MYKRVLLILLVTLAVAMGCDTETDPQIENVEATVSEHVSTVITVTWTTSEPTVGYVEFGPTEKFGHTTPIETEPATEHDLMLLGMTANTEVFYRVVIWEAEDSEGEASDTLTITTGPPLSQLPPLDQKLDGDWDANDQYIIVPVFPTFKGPTIISPEGEFVWYWKDGRELEFFRARLSRDGKAILYNAANVSGSPSASADSEIVRVSLDGSEVTTYPVPMLAHDFIEMEDGTLAAIQIEFREYEHKDLPDNQLRGDNIVEINPEDGSWEVVWSAWDCLDPEETWHSNVVQGWTFANALDYDKGENAYYLGTLNLSSIIKIDRDTWECPIIFGGIAATTQFEGVSYPWLNQHQFQFLYDAEVGDSLLVFDNQGSPDNYSRTVEYAIDYEADPITLEQVWEYKYGCGTFFLGEVTRLKGGDTFITWSSNGIITRVAPNTPDGEYLMKMEASGMAGANIFGFHTLTPSLYGEWATWSN